jgi:hypothetical protein
MGEGTNGITEPTPEELEADIDARRVHADAVLAELDRRRHEITDWRLQLRRHAPLAALIAGGALLLGAGLIALQLHRRRQRRRPIAKLGRLRQALARAIERPEQVASQPSQTNRTVAAAVSAGSTILAKALATRLRQREAAAP